MGEELYCCPYCGSIVDTLLDDFRVFCPVCETELDVSECVDYFEATAEDMEIEAALERAYGI